MACERFLFCHTQNNPQCKSVIMLSESTFLLYRKLHRDDVNIPESGTFAQCEHKTVREWAGGVWGCVGVGGKCSRVRYKAIEVSVSTLSNTHQGNLEQSIHPLIYFWKVIGQRRTCRKHSQTPCHPEHTKQHKKLPELGIELRTLEL